MAKKENKGGLLTNEQVEKDNQVKGKDGAKNTSYSGLQDTGINKVPVKSGQEENIKKENEK